MEGEDSEEWRKLPCEDRIAHKVWKARVNGYEEASKLFGQWDEDDPKWKAYQPLAKKMVNDSNAVALEKGLECCLVFAENCKMAPKTAGEVIDGVVSKCVAAPKTKTKELATQLVLMYCEIEAQEKVVEQLLAGLANKNPKVISGCVMNLTECLKNFGAKVIKVSPLLKAIVPLMDHRDKVVREEGKKLIIESYRWIGEVMKSQLSGLKPLQLSELEGEFGQMEGGRARAERYLRSQGPPKEKAARAEDEEGEEEDEEEDSQDSALDPYELLDPVDILAKLPKNFYEQVEEKKWQLRKESLDALHPLTQNPKLLPGDYHELVKVLKKFIAKDTNVMLVALAAQCLTGLARGLRASFKQLANSCLPVVLEKFKEKKVNVATALREAADSLYPILGIEAVQEDVLASLKSKTPQGRKETAAFLARCFCQCPPVLATNKKIIKGYVSALLETLSESDGEVREASAEALGALVKFLGENKVTPFMPDLDKLKMEKIKEKAEATVLTGKSAAPKAKKPVEKVEAKPGPKVVKPTDKPAAAKPKAAPGAKVVKPGGAKPASAKAKPTPKAKVVQGGVTTEPELSLEEAEARAGEVFTEALVKELGEANWKARLAAMEEVNSLLSGRGEVPGLLATTLLCRKPGLKDNNFQVLGAKLSAIKTILSKSPLSQQVWDVLTPDLVEKLGDKKNCELCKEVLSTAAEASTFNFVFGATLDLAFAQKSPVVKAECLAWAAQGIQDFGFGGLQPRPALEAIKKGISETNPAVRVQAIALLGVLHWYMGATAKRMFEDEKAALLKQIEDECEKYNGKSLPLPTRGGKRGGGGEEGEAEEEGEEEQGVVEDLVPRQDISGKLDEALCDKLKDKNWKIRKEGLDQLKDLVSSAKFITGDLGPLPAALTPRTTDSNKNLAVQALESIGDLALAMGPHTRPNIGALLPAVLQGLSDSKANVRAAALQALNTILAETSVRDMVVQDIFPTALAKANPFMKTEIFAWLATSLPDAKSPAKEELQGCLAVLYSAVEDRSGEVRKAAQDAVPAFMRHLGFEGMRKAADKLSAVSKNTVQPLLDKARADMPAPKVAPKKSVSAGAVRAPPARDPSEGRPATAGQQRKPSAPGKPAGKPRPGAVSTSGKKKEEEVDTSPPYTANKLKGQRFRDEAKLKLLKWNFATPRPEFVEQLKEQLAAAGVNKWLQAAMFHADFKQHLKALEMLMAHVEADTEALIANLDLLLKWMTLRFFETNPSVNLKGLEYLNSVFTVLAEHEEGYSLHDIEATSFIPYLIVKIGDPKDQIRNSCKSILKLLCKLYPASKLFTYVMTGIGTKNAKQRTECLEEIGCLIANYGTGVAGAKPAESLREMAKQIGDRDNSVRNAALNAITETYFQEGEKLYKLVGNLPDKDLAMLEERIKRASKTRQVVSQLQAAAPPSEPPAERGPPRPRTGGLRPPGGTAGPPRPPGSTAGPPTSASAGAARDGGVEAEVRLRYQAARAGSGGRAPRPVSGAFTLDLAAIEGRAGGDRLSEVGPQLVEHDLHDIIDSQPVTLPLTRTHISRGREECMSPDSSPVSARLMANQEAHQAVNAVIAQVYSTDSQVSIAALGQLDELMKDNEKVELLGPCIDHLFSMCCLQYRFVLQTKMKVDNANGKEVMRLLQYLTMVLMSLYGHRELVKRASAVVLHDLVNVIVLILLEPGVADLPEGGQLVRALNVLTVKIVDRSDHNHISGALVKLLHECIGSSVLSGKYCMLVMKCIWKVIRGLPSWLEGGMDSSLLLTDLHAFLVSYPGSYWKQQTDDTPMRTVKTVIHTLVKHQGESILRCLAKIQDPQASELVPYIRKLLNSGVGEDAAPAANNNNPNSQGCQGSGEKKRMPRFTKSDHEALVEIFKKIGQKELTKQGLQELFGFKQKNPHVDLEPFLAQSSQYFRDYIERGLRKIEEEGRGGVAAPSGIPAPRSSVLSDNTPAQGSQPQHLVYLERLKKLRAAGGLSEPADQENVENYRGVGREEAPRAPATNQRYSAEIAETQADNQNSNSSAPNVDDIRARLAKIKAQAF